MDQIRLGGPGPVADANMQEIPLFDRTQLSLMGEWTDIWFLSLLVLVGISIVLRRKTVLWFIVAALSFLVGMGSYAPSGFPLPMLYVNRALEWFGIGMHLPFHISVAGVIALLIAALHCGKIRSAELAPIAVLRSVQHWGNLHLASSKLSATGGNIGFQSFTSRKQLQ